MDFHVQKPKVTSSSAPASKGTNSRTACTHYGVVPVFKVLLGEGKSLSIYAGAKRELVFTGMDLYIDLTGSPKKSLGKFLTFSAPGPAVEGDALESFRALEKNQAAYSYVPPTLSLTWPDRGVLDVDVDFWRDLWDSLRDLAAAREDLETSVVVACEGGHGRTGTFLAALGLVSGALIPHPGLLKTLRASYCQRAVESQVQKDFLEELVEELFPELAGEHGFWLEGGPSDGDAGGFPVTPETGERGWWND